MDVSKDFMTATSSDEGEFVTSTEEGATAKAEDTRPRCLVKVAVRQSRGDPASSGIPGDDHQTIGDQPRSLRASPAGGVCRPWLPEIVDTSIDPELGAQRAEALEFAVWLLLEKLPPTERAAYVLREALDYPYRQIAEILQLEEAITRQLVSHKCSGDTHGYDQPLL